MAEQWDCEAWPGGRQFGALCWFAAENERLCRSMEQCRAALTVERQRLFDQIQQRAAEGDGTSMFLAREITSPDELLRGEDDDQ